MTRSEFFKSDEMTQIRKGINSIAISGYIVAVLSFIVNVVIFQEYTAIVDSVFMVIMCLLIQLLQSRVVSIILTVYAVFNMIIMSIAYGRLAGWWIVIIGVFAIVNTFKFQKAWKEEKETQKFRDGTYRVDPDSFE